MDKCETKEKQSQYGDNGKEGIEAANGCQSHEVRELTAEVEE